MLQCTKLTQIFFEASLTFEICGSGNKGMMATDVTLNQMFNKTRQLFIFDKLRFFCKIFHCIDNVHVHFSCAF